MRAGAVELLMLGPARQLCRGAGGGASAKSGPIFLPALKRNVFRNLCVRCTKKSEQTVRGFPEKNYLGLHKENTMKG